MKSQIDYYLKHLRQDIPAKCHRICGLALVPGYCPGIRAPLFSGIIAGLVGGNYRLRPAVRICVSGPAAI
jgi:hypothetical protein